MRDFIKFNVCLCYRSHFNNCGTIKELQHKSFIWFCIWLLGAFSDLLAFGSVKIAKIDFFIKSAKSRSFFSGGFSRNKCKIETPAKLFYKHFEAAEIFSPPWQGGSSWSFGPGRCIGVLRAQSLSSHPFVLPNQPHQLPLLLGKASLSSLYVDQPLLQLDQGLAGGFCLDQRSYLSCLPLLHNVARKWRDIWLVAVGGESALMKENGEYMKVLDLKEQLQN